MMTESELDLRLFQIHTLLTATGCNDRFVDEAEELLETLRHQLTDSNPRNRRAAPWASEESIVWLHSAEKYRYLREGTWSFSQRKGFPKCRMPDPSFTDIMHVVAYANLKPTTKSHLGSFSRRIWFVKAHDDWDGAPAKDRYVWPKSYPCEAVDTQQIINHTNALREFAPHPLKSF